MRRVGALAIGIVAAMLLAMIPGRATATAIGQALSIGYPNSGRLVHGQRLRESRYVRFVPAYAKSPAKYGLPALVGLIERAAHKVASKYPGSTLGVGELSAESGGPIAAHHSHQNGRDADVGFYLSNGKGKQVRPEKFVQCTGAGQARDGATIWFDEARNWALVAAILEDRATAVRQIFVYAPLKARLLSYADRIHAPKALREKAAMLMMQPPHAEPHDDHFHVRIACPKGQYANGCVDDARVHSGVAARADESDGKPVPDEDDTDAPAEPSRRSGRSSDLPALPTEESLGD